MSCETLHGSVCSLQKTCGSAVAIQPDGCEECQLRVSHVSLLTVGKIKVVPRVWLL